MCNIDGSAPCETTFAKRDGEKIQHNREEAIKEAKKDKMGKTILTVVP
jgi:hypothetical protein